MEISAGPGLGAWLVVEGFDIQRFFLAAIPACRQGCAWSVGGIPISRLALESLRLPLIAAKPVPLESLRLKPLRLIPISFEPVNLIAVILKLSVPKSLSSNPLRSNPFSSNPFRAKSFAGCSFACEAFAAITLVLLVEVAALAQGFLGAALDFHVIKFGLGLDHPAGGGLDAALFGGGRQTGG